MNNVAYATERSHSTETESEQLGALKNPIASGLVVLLGRSQNVVDFKE